MSFEEKVSKSEAEAEAEKVPILTHRAWDPAVQVSARERTNKPLRSENLGAETCGACKDVRRDPMAGENGNTHLR